MAAIWPIFSAMAVHVLKLCVGAENVAQIAEWQAGQMVLGRRLPVCGTRSWPKRRDEILAGGSLYWIVKGLIVVRQRVLEIAEVEDEYGLRCGFWLEPSLAHVMPQRRRAFQGWRYLEPQDAPADLSTLGGGEDLPEDLRRELSALGVF